jgi:hypothetical protein
MFIEWLINFVDFIFFKLNISKHTEIFFIFFHKKNFLISILIFNFSISTNNIFAKVAKVLLHSEWISYLYVRLVSIIIKMLVGSHVWSWKIKNDITTSWIYGVHKTWSHILFIRTSITKVLSTFKAWLAKTYTHL